MCGEFTVCWGGVGARSRFVLEKGMWTGAVTGIVLSTVHVYLTAVSISGLHFDMHNVILENYIIYGLSLKCYGIVYAVLHIQHIR